MMKKLNLKLFIAVLLFPALSLSIYAQKSVDLKYNVNSGDQFNVTIELDQDIIFEANGQQMALDQLMTMRILMNVKEVTTDSLYLENQMKGAKMTQGIFGMTVTYDSDDPATAQNPMAAKIGEEFTKMINKSFYMAMDHRGNVGKMDLRNLTNNDDIANNMNSGAQFAAYPDDKVEIGDSWEKDLYASDKSDMKFQAVYTLLKLSGKQATIGIEGTITANTMDDMDLNMNGTQKGEMIVDVKTGWLIESKIDQEISLDIEQNGQKYPATISGSIVTTSVKSN